MAGVDGESQLAAESRRVHGLAQRRVPALIVAGVGIGGGVDLDRVGVYPVGLLHLLEVRVHEDAHADATLLEHLHGRLELHAVEDDVEATLGRDLLPPLGHEGHLVRLGGEGDLQHLLRRGHLEVQPRLHHLAQDLHVAILDVPAVTAKVHGDAVRPRELGEDGRLHRVGIGHPPRLSQRGHVVDVDAEPGRHQPSRCDTRSMITSTSRDTSVSSGPSAITRSTGSVPE